VDKVLSAQDAAKLIKSEDMIVFNGFGSLCFPEEMAMAIGRRFLETGEPRGLHYFFGAGQGVWDESRMIEHMSHDGMIASVITSHFTPNIKICRQVQDNKIKAYNLPLGIISHVVRASAGRKPGILTKIGLKTFVDPRNGGGAQNSISTDKLVSVVNIEGEEYLFYKSIKPTVALLRGTTADINGNISMEREAIFGDPFSYAMAVKANGGKVIVQVERLSQERTAARNVKIPGIIVDAIVVEPSQCQTMIEKCNLSYIGDNRVPECEVGPILEHVHELNEKLGRKRERSIAHTIIAKRAALELSNGAVVNLGIGIPEMIPRVAKEIGAPADIILTVESGAIGGSPSSGISFGAAVNPDMIQDMANQFDFYDGGGLDITFVGAMQVDRFGNVNVSRAGKKIIGVGGFINLTQTAKKVVYCLPFTGGGLAVSFTDGALKIEQEGRQQKFFPDVEEISSSGEFSYAIGQKVLYVTERCVFELAQGGLRLIEVAPGLSVDDDILKKLPFRPIVDENIKTMDARAFPGGEDA
jgi:propionate CoA-transferase